LRNWSQLSVNAVPKKHLLIISYYFPPMGGGGIQRISKLLKFWDYAEYKVSVLTVKSSFFYAEDTSIQVDIPAPVSIYRTETCDPFRLLFFVNRLLGRSGTGSRKYPRESGAFLRKISGFLFLPDSRILWLPFALRFIRKIHRKNCVDVILATVPPFTTGIIAYFSKRIYSIPFVVDFRDSWTDNPYLPHVSRIHNFLQNLLEKLIINNANGITFVNPNLKKFYLRKYKALEMMYTQVIRNGYDPDDFPPKKVDNSKLDKIFRIGIMGTVYSQGNSPEPLLAAVSELLKESPDIKDKLRIVFIGKWSIDFLKKIGVYQIDYLLEWVDYLPHVQALAFANGMDAFALAIEDRYSGSENVTPGRIYEYLYFRKPILAMCPLESDIAWLIQNCQAGVVVEYHQLTAIKQILKNWIENKESIYDLYKFVRIKKYHRYNQAAQMLQFINKVSLKKIR
jgi:hypothetical protein